MKVSILILVFNKYQTAKYCVEAALSNSTLHMGEVEFLIWCNSPIDITKTWIKGLKNPKISKIFISDKNIGVSAYNYLMQYATGEYFIELDDDVVPPEGYDKALFDGMAVVPEDVALMGIDMTWGGRKTTFGTRYPDLEFPVVKCGNNIIRIYSEGDSDLVPGTCRISHRSFWNKINHPVVLYGTDLAINKKAFANGYKTAYMMSVNGEVVIHRPSSEQMTREWKHKTLKESAKKFFNESEKEE